MKTFNDYVSIKELAAYDVGTDMLGHASLDGQSKSAITAALQAFEVIMSQDSAGTAQFLNRHAAIPDVQHIMRNHNLDSFKDADFRRDMRRAATKGRKIIKGGNELDLGATGKNDIVATPEADGNSVPLA